MLQKAGECRGKVGPSDLTVGMEEWAFYRGKRIKKTTGCVSKGLKESLLTLIADIMCYTLCEVYPCVIKMLISLPPYFLSILTWFVYVYF